MMGEFINWEKNPAKSKKNLETEIKNKNINQEHDEMIDELNELDEIFADDNSAQNLQEIGIYSEAHDEIYSALMSHSNYSKNLKDFAEKFSLSPVVENGVLKYVGPLFSIKIDIGIENGNVKPCICIKFYTKKPKDLNDYSVLKIMDLSILDNVNYSKIVHCIAEAFNRVNAKPILMN